MTSCWNDPLDIDKQRGQISSRPTNGNTDHRTDKVYPQTKLGEGYDCVNFDMLRIMTVGNPLAKEQTFYQRAPHSLT